MAIKKPLLPKTPALRTTPMTPTPRPVSPDNVNNRKGGFAGGVWSDKLGGITQSTRRPTPSISQESRSKAPIMKPRPTITPPVKPINDFPINPRRPKVDPGPSQRPPMVKPTRPRPEIAIKQVTPRMQGIASQIARTGRPSPVAGAMPVKPAQKRAVPKVKKTPKIKKK